MIKTGIVACENCMQSSVTGCFDILSVASREWSKLNPDSDETLFDLSIITNTGLPVVSFNGIRIEPHRAMDELFRYDLVVLPVIFGDLQPVLSDRRLIDWLIYQHEKGVVICAACAGVFPAAETGLLSGRKATTHWNLAEDFRIRYPDVVLKEEKMLVDEGDFISAGGVTAYMDLSLYLIGRFGSPELASTVSKNLLIDPIRKSQMPYTALQFHTSHGDKTILSIQNWMADNCAGPLTVTMLAAKAGLEMRTFTRRFKRATGDSPIEYLQNIRIGKARSLLETTHEPVDSITWKTGYEDVSSFRRLFKKKTGMTPRAYRKKFCLF